MHTGHRVQIICQTGLQDLLGTVHGLFCRLEKELYSAVQLILVFGEYLCRQQQHSDMGVVAAGMHDAFVLGAIGQILHLADGQGVDVAAQADNRLVPVAFDGGDGTGTGNLHIGDTHFRQLLTNPLGGLKLLPAQLRVAVEMAAQVDPVLPVL